MGWLQTLASELAITLADGSVWWSIGQGFLFGAVCLLFGVWIARFVGLLDRDAPAGETLGVGLASGLLVLAAWWAAIASGGRSSFTPVAIGFAIAIGLAAVRRWRRSGAEADPAQDEVVGGTAARSAHPGNIMDEPPPPGKSSRRDLGLAVLGGALFIVALALTYGSTLTLSARDGVQPLGFSDEAYYSVLGADLARTGTETIYSPSGFDRLDGLPAQTWYHWPEIWLAAAVISIFGMAPLDARHLVVLPILVLAAGALTGTIVRRMTGSTSRAAFLFGFIACIFLAPVPLIPGPLLSSLAHGLVFGITSYGVAAVAVLLALYGLTVLGRARAEWALSVFAGTAAALIAPAHFVIALLAIVGIGTVWTMRIWQSFVATRRLPVVSEIWRRTFITTGIAVGTTVVWGAVTGHGTVISEASQSVAPFNASWRDSVAITVVCSGVFLATSIAWFMVRRKPSIEADLYVAAASIVVTGALVWGALLGEIYMFYLFFGGIAVFATPAAVVAVWRIWLRLRVDHGRQVQFAAIGLCVLQLEFGMALGVGGLQVSGSGANLPVSVAMLGEIMDLPADAKLAYACAPFEETGFWDARLVSLDAHTGRRVVPMCFQAEVFGRMTGGSASSDVSSRSFRSAPQHALYPDSDARPSAADISAFMKAHGIDYIYVDALHPNSLVPDAIPIATSGDTRLLQLR